MKTFGWVLGAAFATGLAATPAMAVTVTNQTDKPHEVTADLGVEEPKTTIEAGKSAKLNCPEGCEIRVPAVFSYGVSAKSGEKIVIGANGMVAHEGSAAASGEKAKSK